MVTADGKTHRSHVIRPFAMSSLESLHSIKVIDDPDHITHPEAVVLNDREAGKGIPPATSVYSGSCKRAPPAPEGKQI